MCANGQALRLRRAREDDCRLLWEWANDPEVRAVSFSSGFIPWGQHVQWFESKSCDPRCVFYIVTDLEDRPIGQIRFDIENREAVVSISIDPKFRGGGCGSTIIELASREAFAVSEVDVIHAYVKQNNEASSRSFRKAGYRSEGTTVISGYRALDFVLMKHKQLVQLIGPITGVEDYNRPAFEAATEAIQALGYEVWNPNDWSDLDFDPLAAERPKEFWMRRSLLKLFDANMVVLLPGWWASGGSVYEFQVACALNLPIVYWSKWVSLYHCVKGAKCGLF